MSRQTQFLTAIECQQAHRLFREHIDCRPLEPETVALDQALDRILAENVTASICVPGFDRSNFDGFAVQAADVRGAEENRPIRLDLLPDRISAGIRPGFEVRSGQAVAIATGGMIPRGADAICLIEHCRTDPDSDPPQVLVQHAVAPGAGISHAGSDIAEGETVLRRGIRLTSRETGTLAALGITSVNVVRRPRVAIISTGDEIIPPGQPLQPGQVYDSNARILADAVRETGGIPVELGVAIDQLDELRSKLDEALASADVVVLSGGTSKGEGDLSYQVVSRLNDPGMIVHGVALKPGKPICLAATANKPVVVLPGFPTSAIFTFHEFVAPVIRSLAGLPDHSPTRVRAELATRVLSETGRTEFLLVGLFEPGFDSNNRNRTMLRAYPMGKGSGSVTTFSRADGFITIDRHTEIVPAGAEVDVDLIGSNTRPADLVVMGSHCLVLERLLDEVQREGHLVKYFSVGSLAGLESARRGDCDLAGIHLLDEASGIYNTPFASESVVIRKGYPRVQGLVFRHDDQRFAGVTECTIRQSLPDILRDSSLLMVNRNPGSGTRFLLDRLLAEAGQPHPSGFENQVSSHHAVCAAIAQKRADWGVAIEPVAASSGLAFIKLADEEFDFAIPDSRLNRPAVQRFLQILKERFPESPGQ